MNRPVGALPFEPPARPAVRAPAAYHAFFDCFNAGQYFEAHEVLEPLWLAVRGRAEARFYQGLIQLAGAFVHWQKGRLGPARALLRRCREQWEGYPARYAGLDLARLRGQVADWLAAVEERPFKPGMIKAPRLEPPAN